MQTPPVEQIEFLEYRTVDSIQLANPGRNLIDMIHEMESVQDWIINLDSNRKWGMQYERKKKNIKIKL